MERKAAEQQDASDITDATAASNNGIDSYLVRDLALQQLRALQNATNYQESNAEPHNSTAAAPWSTFATAASPSTSAMRLLNSNSSTNYLSALNSSVTEAILRSQER
jgi:hypothetical protein